MNDIKRTNLALDMAKLVHSKCKDVPHDIGVLLLQLIDEHECTNCLNCVGGRDEFNEDEFISNFLEYYKKEWEQ